VTNRAFSRGSDEAVRPLVVVRGSVHGPKKGTSTKGSSSSVPAVYSEVDYSSMNGQQQQQQQLDLHGYVSSGTTAEYATPNSFTGGGSNVNEPSYLEPTPLATKLKEEPEYPLLLHRCGHSPLSSGVLILRLLAHHTVDTPTM
jgi:hypothetical protein